jgi:phosphomannomutase
VLFGGKSPNPIDENLGDLKAKVAEDQADLGIALDGSACSFAAVSKDGKIIPADNRRGCGMPGALLLVEKLAREKV